MCNCICLFCSACCADYNNQVASSISEGLVKRLNTTLCNEFFPISLEDRLKELTGNEKKYQPAIDIKALPKNIFVSIYKAINASEHPASSITLIEEEAIETMLTHHIITNLISPGSHFEYRPEYIKESILDANALPKYAEIHKKEVEGFVEQLCKLPSGKKVDPETTIQAEKEALNQQLLSKLGDVVMKINIADVTTTTLNKKRNNDSKKAVELQYEIGKLMSPVMTR